MLHTYKILQTALLIFCFTAAQAQVNPFTRMPADLLDSQQVALREKLHVTDGEWNHFHFLGLSFKRTQVFSSLAKALKLEADHMKKYGKEGEDWKDYYKTFSYKNRIVDDSNRVLELIPDFLFTYNDVGAMTSYNDSGWKIAEKYRYNDQNQLIYIGVDDSYWEITYRKDGLIQMTTFKSVQDNKPSKTKYTYKFE
jgi:hypothetical protein